MYQNKLSPCAAYREQQSQRVAASPSLAENHSNLKSLTIHVGYYDQAGNVKYTQLTYTVNLSHARSVFRFDCWNDECVYGGFELTEELAAAAAKQSTIVVGELFCNGWQNTAMIKKVKCNRILRYRLKLGY